MSRSSKSKKPKIKSEPKAVKEPTANIEKIGLWKHKSPMWQFAKLDKSHKEWGLKKFEYKKIIEKLIDFEGLTWLDIEKQSGGKNRGSNSHYVDLDKLSTEARKRFKEIFLDEMASDYLFSLRLSSKHRLYGILKDGIFQILWNDTEHKIYPLN